MPNLPVNIHTDRLGLPEAVTILRHALTNPVSRVRYRTSTPFGLRLTQALRLLRPRLAIERHSWDQSTPHPAGSTVYHHLQRVSLAVANTIAANLERTGSFVDRLPIAIADNRKRSFLRTQIVGDTYWPLLQGLLAVSTAGDTAHLVLTPVGALANELNAATRTELPNVRFIGVPQLRDGFAVRTIWFLATQAQRLLARIRAGRPPRATQDLARIGIAHNWGLLGQEGDTAAPRDVWWYQASGLAPERCTVVFGRSKLSFAAADASAHWLQSHGFDTATLPESPHPDLSARRIDGIPSLIRTLRDAASYPTALRLATRTPAGTWQACMYLRTLTHVRTWQTILARQNIKVWFDASDSSMDLAALACDSVGAIKLGLFWASEVLPTSRTSAAHAVRFVPGPAAYRAYQRGPGGADLVVEVGSTYQSASETETSRAAGASVRNSLAPDDRSYVIVALDRSSSESSLIPPSQLHDFYQQLVSHAERNSTVRLVIKPKNPLSNTAGVDAQLLKRMGELEATAHATVLDDRRSVLDAAFAGDIVVAFGVSSAGFLTAAAGVPTVFADPSLGLDGPDGDLLRSVGWERGRTQFPNTTDALQSIDRHRTRDADAATPQPLGDLSAFLNQIDPYQDGNSAARVGAFLRRFVDELGAGQPVDQALEAATQAFSAVNRPARVHKLDSE
ncbi:MAG: hypothetical protein O2826_02600 [Chloroflexi bacterium]|nr:hypothetical protein [Chloroflexota bacterium]MDA1173389.1 hypothetical protein [Chloroflexota bacterium]